MAALTVMLVGSMGIVGLCSMGLQMNGNARRITRATAIAQDLLNNIEVWSYGDARLAKVSSNTGDIADAQYRFETVEDPVAAGLADHDESGLTSGGALWNGVPGAALGSEYQRYWNVLHESYNGTENDVQIAVIVRWHHAGGWRRIVLQGMKINPSRS